MEAIEVGLEAEEVGYRLGHHRSRGGDNKNRERKFNGNAIFEEFDPIQTH